MRLASNLGLLLLVLTSCSLHRQNAMQVFEVTSFGQIFSPDQRALAVLEQSTKIVIYGDYVLYIDPHITTTSNLSFDKNGNVSDQKEVGKDTTYNILITKKNGIKGLEYTMANFKMEKGVVFSVDSFLNAGGFGDDVYRTFDYDLGKPSSISVDGKKKTERYFIKKQSYSEPDSIYRYYDEELTDIDFSFSRRLDKEHKSKLYKTMFVLGKIPKGVVLPDTEVPRREMWNGLKRVDEKNTAMFLQVIEKFEKDFKTLGLKHQKAPIRVKNYGVQ